VERSTIWFNYPFGIAITGSPALSRGDTVRAVSFSDNSTAGVTITSGGDFSDFVITDNEFDNSGGTSFSCGIIMSGSHSVIRRNTYRGVCGFYVTGNRNTIVSNDIGAAWDLGIGVWGHRNVIGENHIRVGFMGIQAGGDYNTLRGNTVDNGDWGIYAWGRYDMIKGNAVQNAGTGIWVGGSGIRVNGNRVSNSAEVGIRVESGGNVIAENTALNSATFDLQDDLACGANTWRRNTFGTASASCIQ
jgi:parallel beta-helix repeat protein